MNNLKHAHDNKGRALGKAHTDLGRFDCPIKSNEFTCELRHNSSNTHKYDASNNMDS